MKADQLRNKSIDELNVELRGLRQESFNLRMQRGINENLRSHNIRNVRRNIARVKTILHEKVRQL